MTAVPTRTVRSPAKVNLFLAVTGRRADGYHELVSLMCPVSLHDTLTVTVGGETGMRCSHPAVPSDETNLAWRAGVAYYRALGRPLPPLSVHIDKRIPVAGGMGGGSSNAAAVLTLLNEMAGNPLSLERLMAVGLTLGADVPFFVLGRPAVARGIGERLSPVSLTGPTHVVVVGIDVAVSTASVYKSLNLALTKCQKLTKCPALNGQKLSTLQFPCNDLESVTETWHPVISEAKAALRSAGAEVALMSGSGPTVFGIFKDAVTAQRAARTLGFRSDWDIRVAELLT